MDNIYQKHDADIYKQLGKRIVYLRKKKKMSSFDLSLESGVNKNYLSDLENGRRNPTLKILRRIAIALDIDLSELFTGIRDYTITKDNFKSLDV